VYYQQQAAVQLQNGLTDWFEIKRGVRQSCVMSLDLFNLYGEIILRQLEEVEEGISVNGVKINNIRYADDAVLIATFPQGLQRLLDKTAKIIKEFGFKSTLKR